MVVTGEVDPADLPYLAAVRRRFDRVVLISINAEQHGPVAYFPGVRVIVARDADDAAAAWNLQVIA